MKRFRNAGNITKFDESDKNILLHLNFLRKIHICAFAVLIFWQFSEKIKNSFLHRSGSCASPTSEETHGTPCTQTGEFQLLGEEKQGVKKCGLGRLSSTSRFGVLTKKVEELVTWFVLRNVLELF